MKEIIIGGVRTGKTYKKVLPQILNYKGKIIFISGKNEIEYLNIKNLFTKKNVFDDEGHFDDSIVTDCKNKRENIFIECKTTQECRLIGRLLSETSILDNKDTLLIIDEGLYILGHIEWSMLENLADCEANVIITFLSSEYLDKNEYEKRKHSKKSLQKWVVINI